MDSLLIVFTLIILTVVSLLGGAFLFLFLLIKKARKNYKEYGDFASKIILSMIGGVIVFLATQLKGVYPTDIGGIILYSGIFFFMFFILYIGFLLNLYIKNKSMEKVRIYFDTSAWMTPFDEFEAINQQHIQEDICAVYEIINLKMQGKITLFVSKKVEQELDKIIQESKDYEKVKAEQAKKLISLADDFLPYPTFVLGESVKGVIGYGRIGDLYKSEREEFDKHLSKDDAEIAHFVIANKIKFLITTNTNHFMKQEVQNILKKHDCKAVRPKEFIDEWNNFQTNK